MLVSGDRVVVLLSFTESRLQQGRQFRKELHPGAEEVLSFSYFQPRPPGTTSIPRRRLAVRSSSPAVAATKTIFLRKRPAPGHVTAQVFPSLPLAENSFQPALPPKFCTKPLPGKCLTVPEHHVPEATPVSPTPGMTRKKSAALCRPSASVLPDSGLSSAETSSPRGNVPRGRLPPVRRTLSAFIIPRGITSFVAEKSSQVILPPLLFFPISVHCPAGSKTLRWSPTGEVRGCVSDSSCAERDATCVRVSSYRSGVCCLHASGDCPPTFVLDKEATEMGECSPFERDSCGPMGVSACLFSDRQVRRPRMF